VSVRTLARLFAFADVIAAVDELITDADDYRRVLSETWSECLALCVCKALVRVTKGWACV